MTTDKANEKDLSDKTLQVMEDKSSDIKDKLLDLADLVNKSLEILNDHIKMNKFKMFVYTLMFIVYTKSMIENFGWLVGTIICIVTFLVIYSSKSSGKTKRDISNDLENENAQINKVGIFTMGRIISTFFLFSLIYLTFSVGFYNYFVNPEITIISPKSGDDVKIGEDNTYHKISGISKGLANNQFFHLFVLYRRVDSNKIPGYWYYEYDSTIYNDGSWECWIQLQDLYSEPTNETFVVKSPNNSSNNISTNVDIVAIITRQSIEHSFQTKILTRVEETRIDFDNSVWHNLILFYLPSGKGTFYDENYELGSDYTRLDPWRYHSIPKHLIDSHVTIKPLIAEYNNTEYYKYFQWPQLQNEKLNVEIIPYTDVYKGDTITICVWSCQMPIEEAEVYFNGNLLNKNTSKNGTLFYTVNTSGNYEVTVKKKGFESYTTLLEVKEPEAKFEFSNLLITPSKVESGKKVNISIKAINIGNAKGEYEVKLVINGNIIDSKTINLDVGENTVIEFIHKENNLGEYTVEIDGETDSFQVIIPSIVYILLLIFAIISLGAYIFIYSRSDKFKYSQSDKWDNKGWVLYKLDRCEEALKAFDKAIELKPDSAHAWDNKGWVLYKLDRCEEALKAFDKAIELKPDSAHAWDNKGWVLYKLDRYEEALKAFDKVIELKPDDGDAWDDKGRVLYKLDRYEEALKAFDKAIELKPDSAHAWDNKSWVLYKLDRCEEALKAFDKAIELKPDSAHAWDNKGWVLYKLDRYEEALKAFDKAIELKPDSANAWDNKGWVLYKLDRYEEALKAFDKVIELKPDDGDAWYDKGCLFSTIGDKEKALSCLRKAIDRDISFKEKAKKDKDFEKLCADESFKKLVE